MIKDAHSGRISARDVDRTHIKEFGNWFDRYVSVFQSYMFFLLRVFIVV